LPTLAVVTEAEPFDISTVTPDTGISLVRVRGELDQATSPALEEALTQAPPGDNVVLDLTDCSFIDSSAIRVVLSGSKHVESSGGAMALVVPAAGVLRALEIAHVEARVPIHPTVDAATAATAG
jgi:anti-sigma B factor antagonist